MEGSTAQRLASRLTSLYADLPDDEKALLLAVLGGGGSEVEGYDLNSPRMLTMITQLLEMQHESKKSVIQNLRA